MELGLVYGLAACLLAPVRPSAELKNDRLALGGLNVVY